MHSPQLCVSSTHLQTVLPLPLQQSGGGPGCFYMWAQLSAGSFFFKDFIYLYLERGEGRGERNKHRYEKERLIGCISHALRLTRGRACNPGMFPDRDQPVTLYFVG